jgi:hypothetical protein
MPRESASPPKMALGIVEWLRAPLGVENHQSEKRTESIQR